MIENYKKNLDENLKEYENKVGELHAQNINMQQENQKLNEKLKKQTLEITESHKKEINDINIQITKLIKEIERKDRHLEIIIDKEKSKHT